VKVITLQKEHLLLEMAGHSGLAKLSVTLVGAGSSPPGDNWIFREILGLAVIIYLTYGRKSALEKGRVRKGE
jgi:hypothetical protein